MVGRTTISIFDHYWRRNL